MPVRKCKNTLHLQSSGRQYNTSAWDVSNWTPASGLVIAVVTEAVLLACSEENTKCTSSSGSARSRGHTWLHWTSFSHFRAGRSQKETPTGDDTWAKSWKTICQEGRAKRTSKIQGPALSPRHAMAGSVWELGVFQPCDLESQKAGQELGQVRPGGPH